MFEHNFQLSGRLRRGWLWLVRLGFRLLYNEMAWSYGAVSWLVSLGHWRAWQRAAIPFIAGKRVLELAHGPGYLLLDLHDAGFDAVGLDLSPAMGRLAQRRIQQAGLTIPLARGAGEALPFAAASFDTILATFPTPFILRPETLASARRLLRENGRLVIVPEGHLTGRSWLHRFIGWLFIITGQRSPTRDDEGEAAWTPFIRKLTEAGFQARLEQVKLAGSAATVLIARVAPAQK